MADEVVVGSVAVEVTASARGFARSLRTEVAKSFKGLDKLLAEQLGKTKVKVPVEPDTDGFREEIPRRLPKQRMPKVPVPLDPLVREFQSSLRRQANTLARRIAVKVPVTPETEVLRDRLRVQLAEIARESRLQVPTEPGARRAYEAKLRAMLAAVERDVKAAIPVEVPKREQAKVRAQLAAIGRNAPTVPLRVDLDRRQVTTALAGLGRLLRTTGTVSVAVAGIGTAIGAGAAALTGLASAAAGAIPALLGLASAVASAAGALVAVPGAAAVAGAAVATVALALAGLDKAFKAIGKGDAEALNEALKNLAPNARRLVKEVVRLKPAFDKLRLGVQQRLFAQTDRTLRDLARVTLPTATRGMNTLADAINRQVIGALRDLNTRATQSTLAAVFAAATTAVGQLGVALAPLGRALLDVVAVGAQLTAELSQGVGKSIAELADRISDMAANGELRRLFLDGLAAARQLFDLGQDILGIFGGIARAAGSTDGGGLFAFFDRINTLVNSVEGQAALGDLFAELARLGVILSPVLLSLAKALVPVAKGIADVAEAFAPSLTTLFQSAGKALGSLAGPLSGLAPVANAVAGALGPLATVLGGLIKGATPGLVAFINGLTTGLAGLGPSATAVGAALGGVAAAVGPALAPLGRIIADLIVGAAPGFIAFIGAVTNGLVALVPSAKTFGTALGSVATAIGPALAPLAKILADLVINIAPGAIGFFKALATGLSALAPVAPAVGQALANLLTAVAPLLPVIGNALAFALTNLANIVSELALAFGPLIGVFAGAFAEALARTVPLLLQIGVAVLPVVAQAGSALAEAFLPLVPVFAQVATIVATQLIGALPILATAFADLVPVIAQVAQQFGGALIDALVQIVPMLPELVRSGIQLAIAMTELVVAVAPLLPQMIQMGLLLFQLLLRSGALQQGIALMTFAIRTATTVIRIIGAVVNALMAPFRAAKDAVSGFGSAASTAASKARDVFANLPGQIKAAVGNLGSLLLDAGRNVVQGLIDGIRSKVGALASAASNLAGTIRDYLPFSPAKKGPLSGKGNPFFSGQAIAELVSDGMRSKVTLVASASELLAAQVAFPFDAAAPAPAMAGPSWTNHIYPQRADFGVHDLDALQSRQATQWRLGLPG